MDELRYWYYCQIKSVTTENLPPTSQTIRLHILRCFYIVHLQIHCLDVNTTSLDPQLFGFVKDDDLLVPKKIHTLLPPADDLIPNCNCKICSRITCCCLAAAVPCCSFCFCNRDNTCKNIYNIKENK